jgi:hypothetical protein
MEAYIKMVKAGGLEQSSVVATDASLMSAILRTSAYPIETISIDNAWRGNKDITAGLTVFQKTYSWLFNKGRRLRTLNLKLRVTNDKLILDSGELLQGIYFFDEYVKDVILKGGEIRQYNTFKGTVQGGRYSEGSFEGRFESGVFDLDRAIWNSDDKYIPTLDASLLILYKGRDYFIDDKTFFFPDSSGKKPLFPTFGDLHKGIKSGQYSFALSSYDRQLSLAKKGKAPPPVLLSKAGMALVAKGMKDADLDSGEWDAGMNDDDLSSNKIQDSLSIDDAVRLFESDDLFEDLTKAYNHQSIFELGESLNYSFTDKDILDIYVKRFEETEFKINNLSNDEQDALYEIFRDTYTRATGAAFDKDDFDWRAANWTFFGIPPDENNPGMNASVGGIAVRRQMSNDMFKLVASFGAIRGVLKGFDEFIQKYGKSSIWGIMTPNLAKMLTKHNKDFISPPVIVIKAMEGAIKKLSNGEVKSVSLDGNISVDTPAGIMVKKFICNKVYANWLISSVEDPANASRLPVPQAVMTPLIGLVKKLL